MSRRMEVGLKTLILAIYDEASITAAAKGLKGTLVQLAALRETASLASGPAGRPVGEDEVMGLVLGARRAARRRAAFGESVREGAEAGAATEMAAAAPAAPVRVRRIRRAPPPGLRSLVRSLAPAAR